MQGLFYFKVGKMFNHNGWNKWAKYCASTYNFDGTFCTVGFLLGKTVGMEAQDVAPLQAILIEHFGRLAIGIHFSLSTVNYFIQLFVNLLSGYGDFD